ncbi:unnamed protein product, partial [Timema podura]|nr:unnamed protein product [Timema podura]
PTCERVRAVRSCATIHPSSHLLAKTSCSAPGDTTQLAAILGHRHDTWGIQTVPCHPRVQEVGHKQGLDLGFPTQLYQFGAGTEHSRSVISAVDSHESECDLPTLACVSESECDLPTLACVSESERDLPTLACVSESE